MESLGDSCIVKLRGDVPPAKDVLFWTSSQVKGIIFASFSLGNDTLFGNFGQGKVKFVIHV